MVLFIEVEEIREELDKKYTRKYISNILEISTNQLSKIFTGKTEMRLAHYLKLKKLMSENKL